MKKLIVAALMAAMAHNTALAQAHGTPGVGLCPIDMYEELDDPAPRDDEAWTRLASPVMLSWGSADIRYAKHQVPTALCGRQWTAKAWRGERVNAQAVLWTSADIDNVEVEVSTFKGKNGVIPSSAVKTSFVRYVMTDELNKDGKGGCGCRDNKAEWDSSLVADVLDTRRMMPVRRNSVQPLWINVWVPRDAAPGSYSAKMTVRGKGMDDMTLDMRIDVTERVLPEPRDWHLDLDLWQNPYAVARYHGVPLWSREHFDAMLPIMKMLASIGQGSITASIMHKPWNGQTQDHYDSMVTRIKRIDGTWHYDYAVFDKYVEFMMKEAGIDRLISCYTMIPWALSFDYYDEATNRVQFIDAKPGDSLYRDYWLTFLKDFAAHLKQKGWFEKTAISMDERPMEAMKAAIAIIKEADPEFKITLAGNYHDEIQGDLYYLSIPYGQRFPEEVLRQRREQGKISTYYTCCTEPFPGTFSFSNPADATWIGIHAVAGNYDGYLRWAVNSWTEDPLRDSRFRTWAAGDTYSIYPGPRSSIRFERLVEGLQDAEKINVLRKIYKEKGMKAKLARLEKTLATFTPALMTAEKERDAARQIDQLERLLNE